MKKLEEEKLEKVVGGAEVFSERGGRFMKGDRVKELATNEPGMIRDCRWDAESGIWRYFVVFDCGFEYWLYERDIQQIP